MTLYTAHKLITRVVYKTYTYVCMFIRMYVCMYLPQYLCMYLCMYVGINRKWYLTYGGLVFKETG